MFQKKAQFCFIALPTELCAPEWAQTESNRRHMACKASFAVSAFKLPVGIEPAYNRRAVKKNALHFLGSSKEWLARFIERLLLITNQVHNQPAQTAKQQDANYLSLAVLGIL